MQVRFEPDEAWSLMSVITSFVIDNAVLSQDGKGKLRRWRSEHGEGTPAMDELAVQLNEVLGSYADTREDRVIRKKGRYARRSASK